MTAKDILIVFRVIKPNAVFNEAVNHPLKDKEHPRTEVTITRRRGYGRWKE